MPMSPLLARRGKTEKENLVCVPRLAASCRDGPLPSREQKPGLCPALALWKVIDNAVQKGGEMWKSLLVSKCIL